MQLKAKLIAAAAATVVSLPAFAGIATGGNGELFWSIYDEVGQRAYVRDLGVTIDDFLAGAAAGQSWSIANDATLESFLAGTSPDNLANLVWNLGAIDSSGVNRYITTGGTVPDTYSNQSIDKFDDGAAAYVGALNGIATHLTEENGSSITTPGDNEAYFAFGYWGSNFGNNASGMTNTVGIGGVADLYYIAESSSAFAQRFNPGIVEVIESGTGLKYTAYYADGALNITAVPEPSTYAMLGLGLLGIGALARRRRKA